MFVYLCVWVFWHEKKLDKCYVWRRLLLNFNHLKSFHKSGAEFGLPFHLWFYKWVLIIVGNRINDGWTVAHFCSLTHTFSLLTWVSTTFYPPSLCLPPTPTSALKSSFVQFLITFSYKSALDIWTQCGEAAASVTGEKLDNHLFVSTVNLYSKNIPFTSVLCTHWCECWKTKYLSSPQMPYFCCVVCILFIYLIGFFSLYSSAWHRKQRTNNMAIKSQIKYVLSIGLFSLLGFNSVLHTGDIVTQKHTCTLK